MAAGGAVIGALRVVLGADTAALETGLKDASSSLSKFGGGVGAIAAGVGAALASIAVGTGAAIKSAINQADNLSKMSQRIGVPVEELSTLRAAAELSDVSLETLGKSVGKLSKNMVDAAANPTAEAAKAFNALGIAVTNSDGSLRASSEVMADVADKFAGMKDGAGKTAVAMSIFGKAGADMIPLLNSGRAGLKEATDEAKAFGLTVSSQTAKQAENFNDNLTRLGLAGKGVATIVAGNVLPTLVDFTTAIVDWVKSSGAVQAIAEGISVAFGGIGAATVLVAGVFVAEWNLASAAIDATMKIVGGFGKVYAAIIGAVVGYVTDFVGSIVGAVKNSETFNAALKVLSSTFQVLASGAAIVGAVFKAVWDAVAGVASAVLSVIAGKFKEAWDTLSTGTGNVSAAVRDATTDVGAAFKTIGDGATKAGESVTSAIGKAGEVFDSMSGKAAPAAAAAGTALSNFNYGAMGAKNALDSFLISQQKSIAATEAQAATVGKSNAEQAAMKVTQEALAIATANNITVTDTYRQRIDALAQSAANAAMMLQGAQLTQQVQTPAEQYAEKLQLQQQLFEAGAISADTYARAQKKAADDAGTSWDIAGASIAGSFKDISSSFAKESGTMATVAKIAGAIQATISMFTGAAKALELPFPANLAAMASVLATGASLVASIKGTAVPKFATGGSMLVGGTGGIDSQRVAMDVSPGEVITVDQNKYGESIGGGGRTISVEGIEPEKWFSGRQIIELINAAVSDGSRLKIAPA